MYFNTLDSDTFLVQVYLKQHIEPVYLLVKTSQYLQTSLNQSTRKSATTKKINTQNLCHKALSEFKAERIHKKFKSLTMIREKRLSATEKNLTQR